MFVVLPRVGGLNGHACVCWKEATVVGFIVFLVGAGSLSRARADLPGVVLCPLLELS